MSRRTFGKDKNLIEDDVKRKIQPREENRDNEDDVETVTKKYCGVELESPVVSVVETATVTSVDDLPGKCALKSMEDSKTSASRSDIESQDESEDDDEEQKEETNKVIQWTENDQKNLIDLGSSEIERNKRLQSLIAKRWAKKLLSRQPRRDHIDYSREFSASDHRHLESLGSLMVEKQIGDGEKQPVSARLRWMPESNPFDIPYDPHEERPVLTGGSFDEEFFDRVIEHNDLSSGVNNGKMNPFGLNNPSLPSFFTKKAINDKLGSSCFTRDSDVEKAIADNEGKTSLHVRSHDQALSDLSMVESHRLEIYTSSQNLEHKTDLVRSTKSKNEDESRVVQSVEVNNKNESQLTQDQSSVEHSDDCEVSSSSSSCETNMDVTKTEAFRNSVKKVLTCLVNRKGLAGKEKNSGSTSDLLYDSSPTRTMANKMEISYYTSKTRVTSTQSIDSDMQVEVSDTESPKSPPCDPNSPTDRESLVYDGDMERDVNSGDEDLWGVSPHVARLGDSHNNRLEIETVDNASNTPNVLRIEEVEQLSDRGEPSSLSPRSILLEDNMNDLMDQKSTNGDIVQSRSSSSSSSSVRLYSQMKNKSVNVAEYLANLPHSESSSNVLEDPWQSHVRGTSQEEITLQDENNHVLEMDEDTEDSKERKELEASKESSEQTSGKSQSETPKESSSASNEQHELKKEHVDQVPNTIEDNQHSEVESIPLEKDVTETSSSLRESSTHGGEDLANSSRSAQASGESEPGVTSTNRVEGEVKVEPPSNSLVHEASASTDTAEANQHGTYQQKVDTNNEDTINLYEG